MKEVRWVVCDVDLPATLERRSVVMVVKIYYLHMTSMSESI